MTDFTRVTVVGLSRRADVVVASDEPFAGLLPRFVDILDEPIADSAHPVALVRVTGEEISLTDDAATQAIADGEVLHLVRRADAPPPPEVSDVTDAVADQLARRDDTWGDAARQAVAAGVIGAVASVGGVLAVGALTVQAVRAAISGSGPAASAAPVVVGGAAVVLVLAAVVAGRAGARWTGIACTAAATGLALPVGLATVPAMPAEDRTAVLFAIVLAWAWIALGLGLGVGQRMRSVAVAAVVGVVLPGLGVVSWTTPAAPAAGWGVVAVGGLVVCGLLPAAAMSSAGLTGLDDQVASGAPVARARVTSALDDAYRSLNWTTAAVAVPLAAAGAALLTADDGWAIGLGAATVVVTALRSRAFPLALQGVLLWGAVAVAVVAGLVGHATAHPVLVLAVLGGTAVVAALLAGVRPAPHQRARLRSLGNALEMIAVVVTLPLLLGAFGLFARMLETF